jgi:Cys-tRNA(Pro)/Cys-tRNA(Cys) deacylase
MKKTKALEILTRWGIPHEVRSFVASEFTAEEAARELELPLSMLFKTLVAVGERQGGVLAVIPGDQSLSLRKLALAMNDKRVDLVALSDLTRLTGYLKGGVSPLGTKRPYPVFLDQHAFQQAQISVSAGQRGLQMLLAPGHLQQVTRATVADLTE